MYKIKSIFPWKFISISIGLAIAFVCVIPSQTHALSVSPIRYEVSGNPGQVLEEKLNLRNETSSPETYYPRYYNFQAEGETGTPTFVEPKDGLGTWIAGPAGIELAPGDNQTVVFVISIPKDARPGGYFGALLYGTTPPSKEGVSQLAIGSETGPIILLRVNGDIKESASIVEFKTKNNQTFFNALPVEMYYRFQNTGADRTKPAGDLTIRNIFGIKAQKQTANPVEGNVLPGQIRKIELAWQKDSKPGPDAYASRSFFRQAAYQWKNFAFGYFTANLDLTFGANNNQKAHEEVNFAVIPWQLLIMILIVLIFVYLFLRTLIRRYNKWIIKQTEMAMRRIQEEKGDNSDSLKHKI